MSAHPDTLEPQPPLFITNFEEARGRFIQAHVNGRGLKYLENCSRQASIYANHLANQLNQETIMDTTHAKSKKDVVITLANFWKSFQHFYVVMCSKIERIENKHSTKEKAL